MKTTVVHALPIILALAMQGCGKNPEPTSQPLRPVYAIVVPQPNKTLTRTFSGQLAAAEGANLAFEVNGRVTAVYAKQGQAYPAGQLLAQIDTSDYSNSLDNAQASLTQAEQQLRRTQRLFESGNASQSQLDQSSASEKSARANYKQNAKRLEDTSLKMPYEGVIATVNIDAQQVVSAGQTAMTIQGEGPMEFVFGVPTDVIGTLSEGEPIAIRLSDFEGARFSARISEISPNTQNNTTYGVIAKMDSPDSSFRTGMDGEASIEIANGDSIPIPIGCVFSGAGDTQFVWIAQPQKDKTATIEKRAVTIGMLGSDGMLAALSGIQPGELVVSRGVNKVESGLTVLLRDAP